MDSKREEFIEYCKKNFSKNWENMLQLYDNQIKYMNGELNENNSSTESAFKKLSFTIANSALNIPDIKPLSDEELNK